MSKKDNKHPDIEKIKKAISRWKAREKAKKELEKAQEKDEIQC